MSEEIFDEGIELIFFKYRRGVARIRDDPQIGLWDICGDQDRMGNGDDVVVAADHQGWAGDVVQLVERDMGLVQVEVNDLKLVLYLRRLRFFEQAGLLVFHEVIDEWGHAGRIGPEVGAGKSHFFDFIGMADSQQQGIDPAVAPAYNVTAIEVEGIQQGIEVIDDLFEGKRVAGIYGSSMCAGIDSDHAIMRSEIGDLVAHVVEGTAIAMEEQQGFALTVGFVI